MTFFPAIRSAGLVPAISAVILTGCIQLNPEASQGMADRAGMASTVSGEDELFPASARAIEAAINNPSRRQRDREQDRQRQAESVLAFFGISPGMTVLDLYSGGGYYTELLSFLVGASGKVVAHNNAPYLAYAQSELEGRYADGRLANVQQLIAENNKLQLQAESFDAVLMIKAYHDVYYVDPENGWPEIDRAKFLSEIYAALRSDGVLGIVDHVAAAGSPPSTGGTLHRIDPDVIKSDMATAGFIYDGESLVLRNADDDLSQAVFSVPERNTTDRVVLRFRKP
jgi:predicted methyltransferase